MLLLRGALVARLGALQLAPAVSAARHDMQRTGLQVTSLTNGSRRGVSSPSGANEGGQRAADFLLSRLADPTLLHTAGYIGGEWLQATDRATYEVGWQSLWLVGLN